MAETRADDRVQIHLRVPREAKRRLQRRALEEETNLTDLGGEIVCASVGIEYESRSNRKSPFGGGRPRAEAETVEGTA